MEWLDDPRTRKARHRYHQQWALCRPAHLEPAALRQRPEHRAAGVAHERGIGVDCHWRFGTQDYRRWTLASGENAPERNRRQVCQCHRRDTWGAIESPERLAPAEGAVFWFNPLRRLRWHLLAARPGPLCLFGACYQRLLREHPHDRTGWPWAACTCRAQGPDDGTGDGRRGDARLRRGNEPAQPRTPRQRRRPPLGVGEDPPHLEANAECDWRRRTHPRHDRTYARIRGPRGRAQGTSSPGTSGHSGHPPERVRHLSEEGRAADGSA
jgi:hypothetical protein